MISGFFENQIQVGFCAGLESFGMDEQEAVFGDDVYQFVFLIIAEPAGEFDGRAFFVALEVSFVITNSEDAVWFEDATNLAERFIYLCFRNVHERGVGPRSIERAVIEGKMIKVAEDGYQTTGLAHVDHGL